MAWDKDWPEDAKTGPKFLAELMRRHPDSVKIISSKKDMDEFFQDSSESDNKKPK